MLRHTLAQINGTLLTASEVIKKIDLLAIRWIKQAWEAVKVETIVNCFRHCGVQLSLEETAGNPFADLEQVEGDVEELVQQIDSDMPLTTSEYVGADEDVSTCATFENSENWRQELRDMVVSNSPC